MKHNFKFDYFIINNHKYIFNIPIDGELIDDIVNDKIAYWFNSDYYNIFLLVYDYNKLQDEFNDEINFIIDFYIFKEDTELSTDAIEFRNKYIKAIGNKNLEDIRLNEEIAENRRIIKEGCILQTYVYEENNKK